MALTSLSSRSKNGDVLVSCNPHRFIRQFRIDQGAVVETGTSAQAFERGSTNTLGWAEIFCLADMPPFNGLACCGEGFSLQATFSTRRGGRSSPGTSSVLIATLLDRSRYPYLFMFATYMFVSTGA